MTMNKIRAFFASPSNRYGLSVWCGTALTAAAQVAITQHSPPMADILGIVIGLVLIIQPDNSVTVSQLEKAIADTTLALTTKSPVAALAVVQDAEGLITDVLHPTQTESSKP
jgi:hypothetical protein